MRFLYPVFFISVISMLGGLSAVAQNPTPDTAGYETQRQKVNELLDQRTERFGKFNESLTKRTGIFGLKTKKDMQASIDILKEIVLTDNDIFRETKMLLDYKDFQTSQVTQRADEYDGRINGYIKTISKLQREQERLTAELEKVEKSHLRNQGLVVLLALVAGGMLVFLIVRRQKLTKA